MIRTRNGVADGMNMLNAKKYLQDTDYLNIIPTQINLYFIDYHLRLTPLIGYYFYLLNWIPTAVPST